MAHKPKHSKSHLRKMIADEQKGIREYSKILSDEKKHLKSLKKQLKRYA